MNNRGYYGNFGGAFIPEVLVATFEELVEVFEKAQKDPLFWQEYVEIMSTYSCRPTPLTLAENLSRKRKVWSRPWNRPMPLPRPSRSPAD
jgi:tryptophan synthase beta chain